MRPRQSPSASSTLASPLAPVGADAAGLSAGTGATRPAYGYGYYDGPVRSCDMVERFDRWGNVIGYRRVCGYY